MLNCAAFGCNNTAVEGSGLNFNHFLKDSNMRDWIYYCIRMDFTPGDGHRMWSVRFTNKCYDQDPEDSRTRVQPMKRFKTWCCVTQNHFWLRKKNAIQKNLVKCEGHMQNGREHVSRIYTIDKVFFYYYNSCFSI